MGGFAQDSSARCNPVSDPAHHLVQPDSRIAKEAMRAGSVAEESRRRLHANQGRRAAEELTEAGGNVTDRDRLRAGEVQYGWGARAQVERPQSDTVGITLPDHVHVAHSEIDRF